MKEEKSLCKFLSQSRRIEINLKQVFLNDDLSMVHISARPGKLTISKLFSLILSKFRIIESPTNCNHETFGLMVTPLTIHGLQRNFIHRKLSSRVLEGVEIVQRLSHSPNLQFKSLLMQYPTICRSIQHPTAISAPLAHRHNLNRFNLS